MKRNTLTTKGVSPAPRKSAPTPQRLVRSNSSKKQPLAPKVAERERDPDTASLYDPSDYQPIEVKRVPDDQIKDLTPEQLQETFTKSLTVANPNVSRSMARFNYKDRSFKLDTSVDQLMVHFSMESTLMLAEGDEAKAFAREKSDKEHKELDSKSTSQGTSSEDAGVSTGVGVGTDDGAAGPTLKNQFNFTDRASQTFNNPMRDRQVATEPPPCKDFNGSASQWEIFDAYLQDFQRMLVARNAKENAKGTIGAKKDAKDDTMITLQPAQTEDAKSAEAILQSSSLLSSIKIMERMVNQNAEDEIYRDYRFYDNEADQVREDGKGELLPLWRFQYSKAKRRATTAVIWNPKHTDLFAVGYGSYDFLRQGPGLVCCFSLKNTSHPEYTFTTSSGVMCLDFNAQYPYLLAVGLYDGSVCVFDVRSKTDKPLYTSNDPSLKRCDPVWQISWQPEDVNNPSISFYSVSSDGRVSNWTVSKNELVHEEVVQLKLLQRTPDAPDSDEPSGLGLAGGCCFDFNKRAPHLFVVGTEEGAIQSYSKAHNTQFLDNYEGHHMAVYGVKWNPFHPRLFLSCSADWTVKLWDHLSKSPVLTFDLANSVGDIAWSPFSSSVFATVTSDGRLLVYDLQANKHEPVGETRVSKKARLTHVCFNPTEPIVLVGDETGNVVCLKLSPNLRKMSAPKIQDLDPKVEVTKLDKLLLLSETATMLSQQMDPVKAAAVAASMLDTAACAAAGAVSAGAAAASPAGAGPKSPAAATGADS